MSTYILRKFNWKFLINTRNILFAIFRSFKHRRVCFNISRYNFLRRNVKSFATYNVIANDASTRISRNVRIIRLQPRVSHVNPRNDATRFFKIHISARIRFLAGAREARLSLSLSLVALIALRPRQISCNLFVRLQAELAEKRWVIKSPRERAGCLWIGRASSLNSKWKVVYARSMKM